MALVPSPGTRLTLRLELRNRPGMLGRVASAIGEAGGDIGAVDLVESAPARVARDITVKIRDDQQGLRIVQRLRRLSGVRVVQVSGRTFLLHHGGKIELRNKVPVRTRDDLSMRACGLSARSPSGSCSPAASVTSLGWPNMAPSTAVAP